MKHYVYKITNNFNKNNNINPYYYIGVRTSKCDNIEDDDYMGSSKYLTEDINKIGLCHFNKEILSEFESREKAEQYEYKTLKKLNIINNDIYYNKCLSLSGNVKHYNSNNLVSVKDETGNTKQMSKEKFDKVSNLVGVNKGRRYINNGLDNKFIFEDEFQQYLDEGWKLGVVSKKTLYINNCERNKKIDPKDLDYYLQKDWVEGKRNFKKHKKYYTNNKVTKAFEEGKQPSGWNRGSLNYSHNKNKIKIFKESLTKYVKEIDLQTYLDDGWKLGAIKRIWIYKYSVNKFILPSELQQYLDDGWKKGKNKTGDVNRIKGRKKINKDGICKSVNKNELQSYLDDGWSIGMK